ncbi:MAG TPA: SsrA-binding protein SmpB [Phycisphaerales bacterium]|nr:SsrA-binding protein SmpB [Phycisphaerales bacterium]
MAKPKPDNPEPEILNRRARHDYHIAETFEVGIALRGSEVKSVRKGEISLAEGYIIARTEPYRLDLVDVHIGEYKPAGTGRSQHAPTRARTLLAHRREIKKLEIATQSKGTTIVPLKLYFKNGFAKLLIGLATGKKEFDKRQSIQKRETQRDINRAMSRRR